MSHEIGHYLGTRKKITEAQYEALYKKIESHVDVAAKSIYKNYTDPVTGKEMTFKNFKDFIDHVYKSETGKRAEERIMNIVEFLTRGDKTGSMLKSESMLGSMIKSNTWFDLKNTLKAHYEGKFEGEFKNNEIGINQPQQIVDLLYRIGQSGKKGKFKLGEIQMQKLKNLVMHEKLLVDVVKKEGLGEIVGKNIPSSSKGLSIAELKVKNEKLFQTIDTSILEEIQKKNWPKDKKLGEVASRDFTVQLAYKYFGFVMQKLQKQNLKNIDLEQVALDYITHTSDKSGLIGKMEAYDLGRIKDGISLAKYLNSSTAQGPLIDVSLIKFIVKNPNYNNIILSTSEKGVSEKIDKIIDAPTNNLNKSIETKAREFGPLDFNGFNAVNAKFRKSFLKRTN